jgi:CHAT domain-containing protein
MRLKYAPILKRFSAVVLQLHGDRWLSDFLNAPFSESGNRLLRAAIEANYRGDVQRALDSSIEAREEFARHRNAAGVLRSEFERMYALRRQSRAQECLESADRFNPPLRASGYSWLLTQWLIETSVCETLLGRFDGARLLATESLKQANAASYPSLSLRALALEASLHDSEGRFRHGWDTNEKGLAIFWAGSYKPERAFQFYSDLELVTEKQELWHLAEDLQKEVQSMLADTGRIDFQAIAHFHRALAAQMNGNIGQAEHEYLDSEATFAKLPAASVRFYRADAAIGLVETDIQSGHLQEARERLDLIGHDIAKANSFLVALRYEKAWSHLDQKLSKIQEERLHLARAIAVARNGFTNLTSENDRWEWDQEVGDVYRRFIEIEVSASHDPEQAFAHWELFKAAQSAAPGAREAVPSDTDYSQARIQNMSWLGKSSVLVSFAVFPRWTIIWVVDSEHVEEHKIPISSEVLARQIRNFYSLCADPNSPIEKVNLTGSRLYKSLFGQTDFIGGAKRIMYVEADSILGQVPWPALVADDDSYLGENIAIAQTANALVRSGLPLQLKTSRAKVVIAYPAAVVFEGELFEPLPSAVAEVTYLGRMYPKAILLSGSSVQRDPLIRELSRATMFFFVGHARSRDFGGELLIDGPDGGDVISSSTIRKLNLRNLELTVLSACSTAHTRGDPSRDPTGLVQAFISAGTQEVVAGRWEIDSTATTSFMKRFYSSYQIQKSASVAAQIARRGSAREEKRHPYYWAGFEVFQSIH